MAIEPLQPDELYHRCDLSSAEFETSAELAPISETLCQERAVEALEFGIGIPHEGYNFYVMGTPGLGKHALVSKMLAEVGAEQGPPDDWCYVADFKDPTRPTALRLPAGKGRSLLLDMEQLLEDLLTAIPAAFQSDEYRHRSERIAEEFKAREEQAAEALAKKATEQGVALMQTPTGYSLVPQKDGNVLGPQEFQALPEEERRRIGDAIEKLREELAEALSQIPIWQREMRKRIKALNRDITEKTVSQLIAELQNKYATIPEVPDYLQAVRQDIIENVELFRLPEEVEPSSPEVRDNPAYSRYRVNVLVDNSVTRGMPIVYEDNPSYLNLVGRVEHIARLGALVTDFTLIRPGAMHKANGGFLILDVERILTQPFAWEALKRVIKSREIRIEPMERLMSLITTLSLDPEPIPIDFKIVLVGSRELYYLLKTYDPDFDQLFKIAADFTEEYPRSPENDLRFARLAATLQQREALHPISRAGLERIVEHSARQAGDAERVLPHIGALLDLMREAERFATRDDSAMIDSTHVQAAIEARQQRLSQVRERLHDEVLRGDILIDTEGRQLGRINGLTVFELGDFRFGHPTRISATARIGTGEVVDIEREVELGGPIHAKGVYILSAYLARRYAKHHPLSLAATLVFEQTYSWVEGDSASMAELCALLSALADVPLRQQLAITGSVNQHGEAQVIGGVNEKIEGFFDICKARGLTGEQGVIIPEANIKHLMLRHDVVQASTAGQFNIYAVEHVEQAMELLTGLPAGVADAKGAYPAGSINALVQARLAAWFELRQRYSAQMHG
ncbi:MAG TPA: ATP-binding protein [Chromatiales bacterium]|nr:ATP-binding protein [Chromatiales bacterium]